MITIYNLKCLFSFINSISILYINTFIYEWASYESLAPTVKLLSTYLILDSILGFNYYIRKDKLILFHHILFLLLLFLLVVYTLYDSNDLVYHYDIYKIYRWMLCYEITTVLNVVRIYFTKTKYEQFFNILFGVSFIVIRTIVCILSYYELFNNSYFKIISPFVFIITALNVNWMSMIINKARQLPLINNIPTYNKITRLTVFVLPLPAIILMNNGFYYSSIIPWMSAFVSVLYHYGFTQLYYIDFSISILYFFVSAYVYDTIDQIFIYLISSYIVIFFYCLSRYKKYEYIYGVVHLIIFMSYLLVF